MNSAATRTQGGSTKIARYIPIETCPRNPGIPHCLSYTVESSSALSLDATGYHVDEVDLWHVCEVTQ